jgi:hypothetical protein
LTVAEVATTPAGGTVTYTWLADGVEVKSGSDAAARTYAPVAADVGKPVTVRAAAELAGHEPAEATSSAVTVVAADQLAVGAPVIEGEPKPGSALSVEEILTDPPGGTVTYTWLVDGQEKKSGTDADARTYTPAAADVGKTLVVRVTAALAGYADAANQSAAVTIEDDTPALRTEADVTHVAAPAGAVVSGQTISASVASGVAGLRVDLAVSGGASWRLCADAACASVIADRTIALAVGENTAYVEVTAEDGGKQVYALLVTRAARALTGATVQSAPAKTAYVAGEALDLSGLTVVLSYDDDTVQTVGHEALEGLGLSTSLAHGTVLTSAHGGHVLKLTGAGLGAGVNLATLAVTPAGGSCPGGQHWDDGLGQCVADGPGPTPAPPPTPTDPRTPPPGRGSVGGDLAGTGTGSAWLTGLAGLLMLAGAAMVRRLRAQRVVARHRA